MSGYAILETDEKKREDIKKALQEKGYIIGRCFSDYIVTYQNNGEWRVSARVHLSSESLVLSVEDIPSVAQINTVQKNIEGKKAETKPLLTFPAAAEYKLIYTRRDGETNTYYVSNPIEEDKESITCYVKLKGVRKFIKSGIKQFTKIY